MLFVFQLVPTETYLEITHLQTKSKWLEHELYEIKQSKSKNQFHSIMSVSSVYLWL